MSRFRFSLLGLAGSITAIAIGCASLVNASVLVSRLVWGGTLLCLTFALLCALLAAPARRGFWVGFAVVGWLYVLFAYGLLSDLANVTSLEPVLKLAAERMPQAKRLQSVTIAVDPSQSYLLAANKLLLATDASQKADPMAVDVAVRYLSVNASSVGNADFIESFVRISHALIALLVGIAGGITGHIIRRRATPVASAAV
jgi:hypothetical protein